MGFCIDAFRKYPQKKYSTTYCSKNDQCFSIGKEKVCDGKQDCPEGSDEDWETCCLGVQAKYVYSKYHFTEEKCRYYCTNAGDPSKYWIPFSSFCDGLSRLGTASKDADCADGTDEDFDHCCKSGNFPKYNKTMCQKFTCNDGTTIPKRYQCDGVRKHLNANHDVDCKDGSDENLYECCKDDKIYSAYNSLICGHQNVTSFWI